MVRTWALCAIAASAAVLMTGCDYLPRRTRRVAQDITVVVLAPIQIPLGVVVDTVEDVADGPGWSVPALPLIMVSHMLKHTYATAAHVIDIPLAPIHLVMNSRRMRIYRTSRGFPFKVRSQNLRDGTGRATHSARQIFRRFVLLAGDAVGAGITAAGSARTWYTGIPIVPLETAQSLVTSVFKIVVYTLDYAVSPLYIPFGPRKLTM